MAYKRRIMKEMLNMQKSNVEGLQFCSTENISHWYINITIKDNPLYPNDQHYRLEVVAGDDYPIAPPMVRFVLDHIPIHPHIYSNGHICLDILGDAWTPVQTIESIAVSVQSLLASNHRNERPPDDNSYTQHAPKNPLHSRFHYDDDTV